MKLDSPTAIELITRLATDDVFRSDLIADPQAVLASLGVDAATIKDALGSAEHCACVLADKSEFDELLRSLAKDAAIARLDMIVPQIRFK